MKKKIRIFALLLVVAMLLSAFAYAHEETDSAKIHLTGETLSEADDVQAIGSRAIFISTQNKIASVDDSQQEYVAEYVPEYQIEFAIPYQNKGVMIGSEKPTMHSVRDLSLRKSLRTSRWRALTHCARMNMSCHGRARMSTLI